MLLLYILQAADTANQKKSLLHPLSYPLDPVMQCQGATIRDPCIGFMYYPNTIDVTNVMQIFATKNAARKGGASFEIQSSNFTSKEDFFDPFYEG